MIKQTAVFFLTVLILIAGCAKAPEKTDIEKIIQEMNDTNCGNGKLDDWEECDFKEVHSCNEYDPEKIGPLFCDKCKLNAEMCEDANLCSKEKCNDQGKCTSSKVTNYEISCECFNYRTGTHCERCLEGFFFENNECVSQYCVDEFICGEFEICNDSSGQALCECSSLNQNPEDCSKCLSGYDWDPGTVPGSDIFSYCRNKKEVQCDDSIHDSKKDRSFNVIDDVMVNYSDEYGWEQPENCDWQCGEDYNFLEDQCLDERIGRSLAVFFNKDNEIIRFRENGSVFKIDGAVMVELQSLPVEELVQVKILPDGNYCYLGSKDVEQNDKPMIFGIVTPDGREIISLSDPSDGVNRTITFTNGGNVFLGDVGFKFPLIKKYYEEKSNSSVTVIDEHGNFYTVYLKGEIIAFSKYGTLLWRKIFNDTNFSQKVSLDSRSRLFAPYQNANSSGIYILNTVTGDVVKELMSKTVFSVPSISIGKNFMVVVALAGKIQLLSSDADVIRSIVMNADNTVSETAQAMITSNGYFYTGKDRKILAYNSNLKELWSFDCTSYLYKDLTQLGNKLFFMLKSDTKILKGTGIDEGDWPQYLHDSMQSGSLEEIEFVDPPIAPVSILPENSAVFNTNSVTFSWQIDSGDPEIKYTLLLRDSSGYDKVYAGPQKGLSTATVDGLSAGTYEWRVVSQDENGSLNVSEARTFTIQ